MIREDFRLLMKHHNTISNFPMEQADVAKMLLDITDDDSLKAIGKKYFLDQEGLGANLVKSLQTAGIEIEGDWD
jgi:hypothetical protein